MAKETRIFVFLPEQMWKNSLVQKSNPYISWTPLKLKKSIDVRKVAISLQLFDTVGFIGICSQTKTIGTKGWGYAFWGQKYVIKTWNNNPKQIT